MNTLQTIIDHGLSVRQIPLKVISTYEMRHRQEGDEIVEGFGRKMCQRTRIPNNAGWWMCQQVNHTGSKVDWCSKEDNLAPTLEESVQLFLSKVKT